MQRKRILLPLILILVSSLLLAGCENEVIEDVTEETGAEVEVFGTVAINRQGEGDLSGITVTVDGEGQTVTTDENGKFSLTLNKGETYDLVVTRDDLATSKVQDLYIDEDNPIENINIMLKKPFSNDEVLGYNKTPPNLTVEGIKNLATLNTWESLKIKSDKPIYMYYVGLNETYVQEYYSYESGVREVNIDALELPLNYGGGISQLIVTVMDNNHNITHKIYQVKMPEAKEGNLPEAVDYLEVTAKTYNTSINLLDIPEVSIEKVEEDTMLYTSLDWYGVEDADSYNVYRSHDGKTYQYVDTVFGSSYIDIDSSLNIGEEVWYRVTAVNESGESGYSPAVYVTPLPVYELSLVGPSGTDVSITPDLIWETNDLGIEGLDYYYAIDVVDTNINYESMEGWWTLEFFTTNENLTTVNTYDFGITLDRGKRYEWNIVNASAEKTYINSENAVSKAVTYGAYSGFDLYPENSSMFFETKN